MELTNKHGLPEAIVNAVKRDPYKKVGDISVTGLIAPPRLRQLEARHASEITEDASERIWSLLGQSVHQILERAALKNVLTEERMVIDVLGWKVSGQPDLLDADGTLSDYKCCGVLAVKNDLKAEWEAQLNVYAWMYRKHGFGVGRAQIVAILRDWSSFQAMKEPSYPQAPVAVVSAPLWPDAKVQEFVEARVRLHQEAAKLADDDLPECSASERWEKPASWAIMKNGNKRATKVCESSTDATAYLDKLNGEKAKHSIVYRPGESTRCARFCKAAPFCSQFKAMKSQSEEVGA